ncbi:MAG: STAS domain-containing protein [Planctomycetota bacterium]
MKFKTQGDELFLSEKITLTHVSSLLEIMQKHIGQCREQVIINLREVSLMDINALQVLISAKKSAKKENKKIILSEIHPDLYKIFILSGIDSIFKLKLD